MESDERLRTRAERQVFERELTSRIGKSKRRKQLLRLEKERRGVTKSTLVFVGARNVARYWWCALQSVLLSRQREQMFFDSYLEDRLTYAYELGRIDDLPDSDEDLLEVGDDLKHEDIERLLQSESADQAEYSRDVSVNVGTPSTATVSVRRGGTLFGEVQWQFDPSDALAIGNIDQIQFAESYPTFRWHFSLNRYVVVGIPDGISDDFVYEFKSSKNDYIARFFTRPVAKTQADIYGLLFRRDKKRVQIRIRDQDELITIEEPVNEVRVQETVSKFAAVDDGQPPRPPKAWKCKSAGQTCEVREQCPIKLA